MTYVDYDIVHWGHVFLLAKSLSGKFMNLKVHESHWGNAQQKVKSQFSLQSYSWNAFMILKNCLMFSRSRHGLHSILEIRHKAEGRFCICCFFLHYLFMWKTVRRQSKSQSTLNPLSDSFCNSWKPKKGRFFTAEQIQLKNHCLSNQD